MQIVVQAVPFNSLCLWIAYLAYVVSEITPAAASVCAFVCVCVCVCSFAPLQSLSEGRTETARKSGKAPAWRVSTAYLPRLTLIRPIFITSVGCVRPVCGRCVVREGRRRRRDRRPRVARCPCPSTGIWEASSRWASQPGTRMCLARRPMSFWVRLVLSIPVNPSSRTKSWVPFVLKAGLHCG